MKLSVRLRPAAIYRSTRERRLDGPLAFLELPDVPLEASELGHGEVGQVEVTRHEMAVPQHGGVPALTETQLSDEAGLRGRRRCSLSNSRPASWISTGFSSSASSRVYFSFVRFVTT
jgi:hypothetical protein